MNTGKENSYRLHAYIAIKWLMSIKGIGRISTVKILEEVKDIELLAKGSYDALKGFEKFFGKPLRAILPYRDTDKFTAQYHANTANNEIGVETGILTYLDNAYPDALKELHDPPVILYYKGNIDLLKNEVPKVAIVGTRVPSEYGRKYGNLIGQRLSDRGYAVVSGMAMGIDAVAHKGAIEMGQRSIGVLGCGLDQVYPKQNEKIYKQILEKGLLLSEYERGTMPHPIHFPERNRIIAGLSESCIVIEAAKKSGSLITAEMTLDLGRDVYALPGPIYSSKSIGCHELIKNGAAPIVSIDDLERDFVSCLNEDGVELKAESIEVASKSKLSVHPIVKYLNMKGEATLEELIAELKLSVSEALEELDNLVLDNQVQMKGFLYHL